MPNETLLVELWYQSSLRVLLEFCMSVGICHMPPKDSCMSGQTKLFKKCWLDMLSQLGSASEVDKCESNGNISERYAKVTAIQAGLFSV